MKRIIIVLALFVTPLSSFAADDAGVKDKANEMFTKCDSNHDGKISKEEFTTKKLEKFTKYDADKDGALSKEEHAKMAVDFHDKMD